MKINEGLEENAFVHELNMYFILCHNLTTDNIYACVALFNDWLLKEKLNNASLTQIGINNSWNGLTYNLLCW